MTLSPVDSSHIAAIGYLDIDRVLLVRFQDGTLRAWLDVTADEYAALACAPSKGKALHALRGTSVLISRKEGAKVESRAQGTVPLAVSGPLNSIDENAGRCCGRALDKFGAVRTEPWDCPQCGLSFVADMVGTVRHWRIVPHVVILR